MDFLTIYLKQSPVKQVIIFILVLLVLFKIFYHLLIAEPRAEYLNQCEATVAKKKTLTTIRQKLSLIEKKCLTHSHCEITNIAQPNWPFTVQNLFNKSHLTITHSSFTGDEVFVKAQGTFDNFWDLVNQLEKKQALSITHLVLQKIDDQANLSGLVNLRKLPEIGNSHLRSTMRRPTDSIRDIFNTTEYQLATHPIQITALEDLSFVGAIIQSNKHYGFVKDLRGDVYVIYIGQSISSNQATVIDIRQDQIVVVKDLNYLVIK